jgi:hypothetical protein
MTSTLSTRVRSASRLAGLATILSGLAVASVIGFAGAAHASPKPPSPKVDRGSMYGNPAAAAPYWRRQSSSDCAEMAVADVVGQVTGREPSEQQIEGVAQNTPSVAHSGSIWHPGGATNNLDLPVLLAHYGVQSGIVNADLQTLEQELAKGHKVIAGLNSAILWNARGDRSQEDHSVVVIGIDTRAGVVHLNDSGINSGRDEQVSIATFERSWATSHNFAVVTR